MHNCNRIDYKEARCYCNKFCGCGSVCRTVSAPTSLAQMIEVQFAARVTFVDGVNLNSSPCAKPRERSGSGYLLTLGVQVPPTVNPQCAGFGAGARCTTVPSQSLHPFHSLALGDAPHSYTVYSSPESLICRHSVNTYSPAVLSQTKHH